MLVTDIKIIIESNLSKFWFLIRYQDVFLPPEGEENSIFEANGFPPGDNPLLYELIKETRDIVECEDFYLIHKNDLDSTFQTLLADILTHFDSKKEIDSSLAPSKSIPLAGLLPIIADGTRSIFSVNSNKFLNVCRFNRILRTALTSNHLTL